MTGSPDLTQIGRRSGSGKTSNAKVNMSIAGKMVNLIVSPEDSRVIPKPEIKL